MAKIGEMIESKYLKQSDVQDDEAVVTISKVGKANVAPKGQEEELKWLVRFNEFDKPMVLNSTNIKRLARACNSDDSDDWLGKKVVLYVDHDVEFAGNVVGGLRIRGTAKAATEGGNGAKPPGSRGGASFDDMDDDIPFMNPYAGGLWRVV